MVKIKTSRQRPPNQLPTSPTPETVLLYSIDIVIYLSPEEVGDDGRNLLVSSFNLQPDLTLE